MTEAEGEEHAEIEGNEEEGEFEAELQQEEAYEIEEEAVVEIEDEDVENQEKETKETKLTEEPALEDILEEEEEIELTEEELEALFNKNTESFRCLAQILLSRSSLLRHPLYHFPPLADPGIDAAFNYVEPEEPVDNICAEKYKKVCKDYNIVPLSRVVKSLPTKELNLRYYGLTDTEFKAVAKSLQLNTFVEVLDLEENFLNPESAYYIEELLRENNTLNYLNMKECRLGPKGAAILSDGIMLTQSLKELDLSSNDLGTEGINSLSNAFKDNSTIKRLTLAHNNLDFNSAPAIASILKENVVLEELNLAWNNLGTPLAMKTIFDSLILNLTLRSLGLAWNGISLRAAVSQITKYLKKTETLESLDLSNNRIGGITSHLIRNALKKNKSIRVLRLAFNVLTPEDAYSLADLMISKHSPPDFNVLDMENVFVKKQFVTLWKKAINMDKQIFITGILGNWVIKGPKVSKLLFDRAKLLAMKPKRKKMRKDFGHFVLSLPDKPMKKSDFETCVKKFKMKMVDNDLMNEITKLFPFKKKLIDCVALKEKYLLLYPDTQPPPPKKKKPKKGKKKRKQADSTQQLAAARIPSLEVKPGSSQGLEKRKVSIHESQTLVVKVPSEEPTADLTEEGRKEGETVGELTGDDHGAVTEEDKRDEEGFGLVSQDSRTTTQHLATSRTGSLGSDGIRSGGAESGMFSINDAPDQNTEEQQQPLPTIEEAIEYTN